MMYNITETLKIFPYICYVTLIAEMIILEVKNFGEQLVEGRTPEPGRDGFIQPPGSGYEYFVSSGTIAYILKKANRRYHVYVVQGREPSVRLRHDRYGKFFIVREQNEAAVERVVDRVYHEAPN